MINNTNLWLGTKLSKDIGLGCEEKYFKFVGVRFDEFLKWDFQNFKCDICTKKCNTYHSFEN